MALDPRYIAAFNIEDVILDKDTGAPLSGGLVTFEKANQPGILKDVWQITYTSGEYFFTALPNPMTLSSIGTFVDSLDNPVIPYFLPYDADGDVEYYRVVVTSSELVEQFVRDPVPFVPDQGGDVEISNAFQNELGNPQFAEVNFDTTSSTHVYTFSSATQQVVNIAPDWDIIVTSASGTVTVNVIKPQGSLNIVSNPGTILQIQSSGVTELLLMQRLYGSPNLWGSGNLAGSFVAKTFSGSPVTLNMYYAQSNGNLSRATGTPVLIVSGALSDSADYTQYSGHNADPIDASSSVQNFPNAYVEIYFDITGLNIGLTSVMLAATGQVDIAGLTYNQDSNNRQIDHLFHYYQTGLNFKPIPSMLVGWAFPLNPAQFGESKTISTTAGYIWDQTISCSSASTLAVIRNTITGGIQATTGAVTQAWYYLQYLTGKQAKEIILNPLAVNISGFRTSAGGAATVKVYLYRGTAAATVPVLATSLGTVDSAGVFTLTAANWTLIPRGAYGQATGTLSIVNTATPDYTTINDIADLPFIGWQETTSANIADTDKFAIVVTVACPTSGTVVTMNSISLVPGTVATRPAPQTTDQVLRECQYYFEKSYGATKASLVDAKYQPMTTSYTNFGNVVTAIPGILEIQYVQEKRSVIPTVSVYNPLSGTANNVLAITFCRPTVGPQTTGSQSVVFSDNWTVLSNGSKRITYNPVSTLPDLAPAGCTTAPLAASAGVNFQYDIDARLGIV